MPMAMAPPDTAVSHQSDLDSFIGRGIFYCKTIESLFVNVPDDERHKIVCENAARFWRL